MVLLVLLSKQIAVPIDFTIRVLGAPVALAGFLVAVLVLSPEALSALRAAFFANDLQRSVNILLGSALATIGLPYLRCSRSVFSRTATSSSDWSP